MVKRTPIVLRLEIDRGSEPITGRLSADPDSVVAFTGWLAFAAALEKAAAVGEGIVEQPDDDS